MSYICIDLLYMIAFSKNCVPDKYYNKQLNIALGLGNIYNTVTGMKCRANCSWQV